MGLYQINMAGGGVMEDFDNDGLLDIMTSTWDPCGQTTYFHNDGNGVFSDYTSRAGLKGQVGGLNMVHTDYNNDGWMDVLIMRGGWMLTEGQMRVSLLRNNGGRTFTDVTHQAGLADPAYPSQSAAFADYDNDGDLDLFVAGYGFDIRDVAANYRGLSNTGALPRLYRNSGTGGFVDVTREVGLDRVHLPMGANFGDLDNDGFPDFYLGTGYPSFDAITSNVMYRNQDGKSFVDVTFSGGFGHLQKGHGIAFGDIDRDGDQDIFTQLGGFYPSDAFSNALYLNPGHGNHWISVRLVGVESNRAAIGAWVKAHLETERGPRTVHARVTTGGSFGASTLEQEIGLGKARRISSLEVYWPTSDTLQVFRDVPMDSFIEVREGDEDFKVRDLPRVRLSPFAGSLRACPEPVEGVPLKYKSHPLLASKGVRGMVERILQRPVGKRGKQAARLGAAALRLRCGSRVRAVADEGPGGPGASRR